MNGEKNEEGNINRTVSHTSHALGQATYAGKLDEVKRLLAEGASVNEADETPLQNAYLHDQLEVARLPVAGGAEGDTGPRQVRVCTNVSCMFKTKNASPVVKLRFQH